MSPRGELVRNRVMLALAYDAALRREELCSLQTSDLDPAQRTLRVRAETTKNRRERVVPYSAAAGNCWRPTWPAGPISAGRAGRCSYRSRAATMPSR
jgi:site-specific recombinase XerD